MRNTLMICASVAALVAAGGLASAQGMKEQPPAAEQKAPEGKTDRQHVNAPPKSESMKPAPTAQAPEGKVDPKHNAPQKVEAVKPAPTAQAPEGKVDPKHVAPQKVEAVKPAPSAQAPEKPSGVKSERVGEGAGTQPSQHNAPNAAAPVESKAGAPAALSAEHRTKFRETIRSEKVAPLTDVQFSVTIGESVPRTVHLNRLPPRIVEYAPQYRDYEYILVGDEILIIDPRTLMIVAVIPA